jgi:hypothetical protein
MLIQKTVAGNVIPYTISHGYFHSHWLFEGCRAVGFTGLDRRLAARSFLVEAGAGKKQSHNTTNHYQTYHA